MSLPLTRLRICSLLLFFVAGHAHAQDAEKPNSITLHSAALLVPKRFKAFNIVSVIGASYTRNLIKRWAIGLDYSQWEKWSKSTFGVAEPGGVAVGDLNTRNDYKMFSLSPYYRLPIAGHDRLNIGFGVFYAFGKNIYFKEICVNPDPPYDEVEYMEIKHVQYIGLTPSLSYSHFFFKDRIGLGIDFCQRYYLTTNLTEYIYGLHLSAQF